MVKPSPRPPEEFPREDMQTPQQQSNQSERRSDDVTIDPLIQPSPRPPDLRSESEYVGTVVSEYLVSMTRLVIPPKAQSFTIPIYPREALTVEMDRRNELVGKEKVDGLQPRAFSTAKKAAKNREMSRLMRIQPGGVERPDPSLYVGKNCLITIRQRGLAREELFLSEFKGLHTIVQTNTVAAAWEGKPINMIFDNKTNAAIVVEAFQPFAIGHFFIEERCTDNDELFGKDLGESTAETLDSAEIKIAHLRQMHEKIKEADNEGRTLTNEETQGMFRKASIDFNNDAQKYLTAVENYSGFMDELDNRSENLENLRKQSVDEALASLRSGMSDQADLEAVQELKGKQLKDLNRKIKELQQTENDFEDNDWSQNMCLKFDQMDEEIEKEVLTWIDADGIEHYEVPTVAEKLMRALQLAKTKATATVRGVRVKRTTMKDVVGNLEKELIDRVSESDVRVKFARIAIEKTDALRSKLVSAAKCNKTLIREISNPAGFFKEIDSDEWEDGLKKKIDDASLDDEQKKSMTALFLEFFDVFRKANTFRPAHYIEVNIPIAEGTPPIIAKGGRHSQEHYRIIYEHFEKLKAANVVEVSTSAWASPVVVAPKRDSATGLWTKHRLCINYRRINELLDIPQTDFDDIWDTVQAPGTCAFISSFDIAQAFHQCAMSEDSKKYTAFLCPGHGLLQYRTMPFGIAVASNVFVMAMNKVFAGIKGKFMNNIIDDLCVYSKTFEDHLHHLRQIFTRCRTYNLTLAADKVQLCLENLEFCGLIIDKEGTRKDPRKLEAVVDWEMPSDIREVRSWLGFCGFYRNFIKDYAKIAGPLTDMTKAENMSADVFRGSWGQAQEDCFEALKKCMLDDVVLDRPDPDKPFIVSTDWCKHGIGAVLAQLDDQGRERPVAFLSKKLTGAQLRYDATSGEALAVLYAFDKWRSYLYGRHFTLYTDHGALREIFFKSEPKSDKLTRWANRLLAFDFEVKHRAGRQNANADELSRMFGDVGEILEPANAVSMAKVNSIRIDHPDIDEIFEEFVRYDKDNKLKVGWLNCENDEELGCVSNVLTTTGVLSSARSTLLENSAQRSKEATSKRFSLARNSQTVEEKFVSNRRNFSLARSNDVFKLVGDADEGGRRSIDVLVIGSSAMQEGWLPTAKGKDLEVPAVKIAETLRKHYGLKHVILEAKTPLLKKGKDHAKVVVDSMFAITVDRLRGIGFKGGTTVVYDNGNAKHIFVGHVKYVKPASRKLWQSFASVDEAISDITRGETVTQAPKGVNMDIDTDGSSSYSPNRKRKFAGEEKSFTVIAAAMVKTIRVNFKDTQVAAPSDNLEEDTLGTQDLPTKLTIKDEQIKCEDLKAIAEYVKAKENKRGTQAQEMTAETVVTNKKLKDLFSMIPRSYAGLTNKSLFLLDDDGILYFRRKNEPLSKHLIVLPQTFHATVLSACHDYNGHCGRDRTLEKLRQLYWWKGQFNDVRNYVINCDKCLQQGMLDDNGSGFTSGWTSNHIFANWCVDMQGPFPPSKGEGYRYALNMVDPVSRWLETVYLEDCNRYGVAHGVFMQLVSRFGRIENVYCDSGKEFVNGYFKDAMELCSIKVTHASAENHQAMGAVENIHRTIDKQIRGLLEKEINHSNWAIAHSIARSNMNKSVIDKLGYSPFEVVYGMRPRTEMSRALQPPENVSEYDVDIVNAEILTFLEGRKKVVQTIRDTAQQHHEIALHEPNLNTLNMDRQPIQVEVGDMVARKVFAIQGNRKKQLATKLSWTTSGPYKVVEILGESILKLKKMGRNDSYFTAPSRHCAKWPDDNGAVVVEHPTYDIMRRLFMGDAPTDNGFRDATPKGKTDEVSQAKKDRTRNGKFEKQRDINSNLETSDDMKQLLEKQADIIRSLEEGKDCVLTYSKEKGLRVFRVFETTCFGETLRLHVHQQAFMFVNGEQLTEMTLREMTSLDEVTQFIRREKFSPMRVMPKWDSVSDTDVVVSEKQPDGTVPRERVITLNDIVTSFFELESKTLAITFGGQLRNDMIKRIPKSAWIEVKADKKVNAKLKSAVGYQEMMTDTRQRSNYEKALKNPSSKEANDFEDLAEAKKLQDQVSFMKRRNRKVLLDRIEEKDKAKRMKQAKTKSGKARLATL